MRAFESGRCGPAEFARGVIDDWALPIAPGAFLEIFASWPVGPCRGAEELVVETASRVTIGCLSNTNELHWDDNVERWPLIGHFSHQLLSHRLGQVKPDRALFERVAHELGMPPGQLLLLDDNQANVDGARAVGFRAARVDGVEGARQALAAVGLRGGEEAQPAGRGGAAGP